MEVFVKDIIRTPIGKKNGLFKFTLPEEFTSKLINELLARNSGCYVDEVILANSIGTQGNIARNTILRTNLPFEVPAISIDAQCAGGLESIRLGYNSLIANSLYENMITGGMESNSLAPDRYYQKYDSRFKEIKPYKVAQFSPNQESENTVLKQAENICKEFNITSKEMSEWTFNSNKKAMEAGKLNIFKNNIFPVNEAYKDETIKYNIKLETLFRASEKSFIGSHNTAHFHDGAAIALLSKSDEKAIAKIIHIKSIGTNPEKSPFGIIPVAESILKEANLTISDIDLFEIGESFALKPLLFAKYFKIKEEKINIFGGNLAYGHPFGASGTMGLLHLCLALKRNKKRFGLVVIAAAGGISTAVIIENTFA